MFSKTYFFKFLTKWWGNMEFLILLLFNILSNSTAVVSFRDALSVFMILCISAFSATVESWICRLFRSKKIRACLLWFFVALHLLTAVVDIFLIVNFGMIFTHDVLGIIAETTSRETKEFFSTYLTFWKLLAFIAGCCSVILLAIWLSRKMLRNKVVALVSMILSVIGASVYGHMAYSHFTSGEGGLSVSQLHSFTRAGYSYVSFRGMYANIKILREANRHVVASLGKEDPPTLIVVIGESFSLYHSSLYGYSKPTNPRLEKWVDDGSLVVFDDVVSASDHTGTVLGTVFPTDGSHGPVGNVVMFPTLFRNAGYKTILVDSQYLLGQGLSWLTDEELSDIMYDYRNKDDVHYDLDMLPLIPEFGDPELILIHIFGQHFTFADRYTPPFRRFTEADYSKNLSQSEREVVAHYDNATLYNDSVVDTIIKKYQDKKCLVLYFSDHGEEIYEIDDYMGHGNAIHRPSIKYQLRVPLMIWTSPKFRERYPDVVQRINDSKHKPLITQNLSHFLFDVAGIVTDYYRPELSFINDRYQDSMPRYVLAGAINYDEYQEDPSFKPRY